MICSRVKECVECTRHMMHQAEKGKKKRNRAARKRDKEADCYMQPLCQSPCQDKSRQKGCIEFLDCRSKPSCTEKGKTYTLDQSQEYPKHEVMMLHIDGGAITNPEACTVDKCDYALWVKDGLQRDRKKDTAILIELKGKDVRHAVRQVMETLHQPEFCAAWRECARVYGRIVCTSVPRIRSNDEIMEAKEEFLMRGGNLVIKEESYIDVYKEL
nr:hypothetical protein [uncultured Acetatifactor sp.]